MRRMIPPSVIAASGSRIQQGHDSKNRDPAEEDRTAYERCVIHGQELAWLRGLRDLKHRSDTTCERLQGVRDRRFRDTQDMHDVRLSRVLQNAPRFGGRLRTECLRFRVETRSADLVHGLT